MNTRVRWFRLFFFNFFGHSPLFLSNQKKHKLYFINASRWLLYPPRHQHWGWTFENQNGNISFKTVQNPKNNGTLLSSTLKVEESNVPLFFEFKTVLNEIWLFLKFMKCYVGNFMKFHVGMKVQKHKMVISHLKQSKNEKIRVLCFLQLLKFKKVKYPYFFIFGLF